MINSKELQFCKRLQSKYGVWMISDLTDKEFAGLMFFWKNSKIGESFVWTRRVNKMVR